MLHFLPVLTETVLFVVAVLGLLAYALWVGNGCPSRSRRDRQVGWMGQPAGMACAAGLPLVVTLELENGRFNHLLTRQTIRRFARSTILSRQIRSAAPVR